MSSMSGRGVMSGSGMSGNKTPSGYRQGQMQQFTPEQMQLFQQMFGNVGPDSYLSKLAQGDEETFNQIEAPAMKQFSGLQGNMASRFSGMGGGARRSSGFQNSMYQAGSDFAQDLASRRQSMQQQAIKDLMGMSGELLDQRPYDQFLVEKQQKSNPWADFAGNVAGAIPGASANYFGSKSSGGSNYGSFSGIQNFARSMRG